MQMIDWFLYVFNIVVSIVFNISLIKKTKNSFNWKERKAKFLKKKQFYNICSK